MTLIIYDNHGQVFSQVAGSYLIPNGGIQFLEIEVPENKRVKSVDVSMIPHRVVFEDIPLSVTEQLKQNQALMQTALDELILGGGL